MQIGQIEFIPESPPTHPDAGRLGRHRQDDPRNKQHLISHLVAPKPTGALPPKLWPRRLHTLDQGELGACTEFGFVGTVRTKPVTGQLSTKSRRLVADPVHLYELETASDDYPGQYPPDDTGSSVLAAMRLGKSLGIIGGYKWAETPQDAATGLSLVGPGEIGCDWHEGMDHPDEYGVVHPTGNVRGGHAFEAIGRQWDVDRWYWVFVQSWGANWPAKPAVPGKPGYFAMPEDEVFGLIEADGEFAIPLIGTTGDVSSS